ncbi:MAG: hypothetical protein KDB71_10255 [Mycobacterium sp.]|nr:hypothetical protein [Mycobacterium sp.]
MTKAGTAGEMDTIAWQFLCSPYIGRLYWDWPLERRIDAYLRHEDRSDVLNNGAAYSALIDRVMANISRARSDGRLEQSND